MKSGGKTPVSGKAKALPTRLVGYFPGKSSTYKREHVQNSMHTVLGTDDDLPGIFFVIWEISDSVPIYGPVPGEDPEWNRMYEEYKMYRDDPNTPGPLQAEEQYEFYLNMLKICCFLLNKCTGLVITKITENNNQITCAMYRLAKKLQKVKTRTLFHGTTHANSEAIMEEGFVMGHIQRSLCGWGINMAAEFWVALAYAPENVDKTHSVLVVAQLDLPTAEIVPHAISAERGEDGHKKTLMKGELECGTDKPGTVYVSSHAQNTHCKYVVQVIFNPNDWMVGNGKHPNAQISEKIHKNMIYPQAVDLHATFYDGTKVFGPNSHGSFPITPPLTFSTSDYLPPDLVEAMKTTREAAANVLQSSSPPRPRSDSRAKKRK